MGDTVNYRYTDRLGFYTLGGLDAAILLPGSYLLLHLQLTSQEQKNGTPYPLKINNTQFQFYQSEHFHL